MSEQRKRKVCLECKKVARYGDYCGTHTSVRCICGTKPGVRTCANCTPGMIKKQYEMRVKGIIDDMGYDSYVHNCCVPGSKHRPDFLWNRGVNTYILEVDEFGHASYDAQKDYKRMCSISTKINKEVIFVRLYAPCETSDVHEALKFIFSNETPQTPKVTIHRFFGGSETRIQQ